MRRSGILLHITCLPSPYGVGSFGREARRFVDFLSAAGQSLWQMLPLSPAAANGCPYQPGSFFALDPLFLDLEALAGEGLLTSGELAGCRLGEGDADYPALRRNRAQIYPALIRRGLAKYRRAVLDYAAANPWAAEYALFGAISSRYPGAAWTDWPEPLARRQEDALHRFAAEHSQAVEGRLLLQYLLEGQWRRLREYAAARGVKLVGDLPIYPAYHSSDVWAHPELFWLDRSGRMARVAGAPPDEYAAAGQVWNNPLYRWDRAEDDGYRWHLARIRRGFALYDKIRLDHFIGYETFYAIPAGGEAAAGQWCEGLGEGLFRLALEQFAPGDFIAEDLGSLTPRVERLRARCGFLSTRVAQFALSPAGEENPRYCPAHYPEEAIACTGTHDNPTLADWLAALGEKGRRRLGSLVGAGGPADAADLIAAVAASQARYAVFPLQDFLPGARRMNTPGQPEGNWAWRLSSGSLTGALAGRLADLAQQSKRRVGSL